MGQKHGENQDQLWWLMFTCPSVKQSGKTKTLIGTYLEIWWIFHWDSPLRHPENSLNTKDSAHSCLSEACSSLSPSSSYRWIYPCFLFPKLQRPFFCICNLSSEPMKSSWLTSSTAHLLHLCDFLNKPFACIWLLAVNYLPELNMEVAEPRSNHW